MVSYGKMVKAYLALKKAELNYMINPSAENEQAMMDARQIVFLVIGVYIMSALIPAAVSAINNASTSGWTTTQIAIWGIVGILVIATVIIKITE